MPYQLIEPATESAGWEDWSTDALSAFQRSLEATRLELRLRLQNVEYSLEAIQGVLAQRLNTQTPQSAATD